MEVRTCVVFVFFYSLIPLTLLYVNSSEGIQIGGVSSAAGVVGIWTGAHHEEGQCSLFFSHCYSD